jgi:hypothetical protein
MKNTNTIKILFARSNTITGFIVRTGLMSEYNHVGIMVRGMVYDSTVGAGVSKHSESDFRDHWDIGYEVDFAVSDTLPVFAFLETQLGKGYDWKAIVSFPFQRDWQQDNRWMCSELVAECFVRLGVSIPLKVNRVSPRDLLFIIPMCIIEIEDKQVREILKHTAPAK